MEEVDSDAVRVGIGSFHGLPSILRGAEIATPGGARRIIDISGTTLTVEPWEGATAGQTVVLFGPGAEGEPDATALAERVDTVGEEIITRLTPAVRRLVVD